MDANNNELAEQLERFEYLCPSCGSPLPGPVEQCPSCGEPMLDAFYGTFRPPQTSLVKVICVALLMLMAAALAAVIIAVLW